MRTDILERKNEILQWIKQNQSKAFICKQLRCKPETLNSYLKKWGIEYIGNQGGKGKVSSKYKTAAEYTQGNCVKSHVLKQKLIRDGIKENKCEICGISIWQGKQLPLELHHIDCNHFNNSLDNLQILCPNCHSIQEGNNGANNKAYSKTTEVKGIENIETKIKKENIKTSQYILCPICNKNLMLKTSHMCVECRIKSQRVVERPSREELKHLIRTLPFTTIAKQFDVSDNAIRKWCDSYKLPRRSTDIKKYSDDEWVNI